MDASNGAKKYTEHTDINNQIRKLRACLDLTQQEFADRLGIPRNNIAGYETGKRSPSEAVISLICREFHVNEAWLRKGKGEMLLPQPSAPLDLLIQQYGLSPNDSILIERFARMESDQRKVIIEYISEVAKQLQSEDAGDV